MKFKRSYEPGSKYRPGYNYKDTSFLVLKDFCSLFPWMLGQFPKTRVLPRMRKGRVEAASWRLGCRAGEHGRADPQTWLILRSTRRS